MATKLQSNETDVRTVVSANPKLHCDEARCKPNKTCCPTMIQINRHVVVRLVNLQNGRLPHGTADLSALVLLRLHFWPTDTRHPAEDTQFLSSFAILHVAKSKDGSMS